MRKEYSAILSILYFEMVCRHQGFRNASKATGISLSKISREVDKLEKYLNVTLFNSGKKFQVSQTGLDILRQLQSKNVVSNMMEIIESESRCTSLFIGITSKLEPKFGDKLNLTALKSLKNTGLSVAIHDHSNEANSWSLLKVNCLDAVISCSQIENQLVKNILINERLKAISPTENIQRYEKIICIPGMSKSEIDEVKKEYGLKVNSVVNFDSFNEHLMNMDESAFYILDKEYSCFFVSNNQPEYEEYKLSTYFSYIHYNKKVNRFLELFYTQALKNNELCCLN